MSGTMGDEAPRAKICYEQNFEHVRALIPVTYQMPAMAITITGALWYGVLQTRSLPTFGYLFLSFAALMNLGFFFIMGRLDKIIEDYLKALKGFYPLGYVHVAHERETSGWHELTTLLKLIFGISGRKVSQWPEVTTIFKWVFLCTVASSIIGVVLLWLHGLPSSCLPAS